MTPKHIEKNLPKFPLAPTRYVIGASTYITNEAFAAWMDATFSREKALVRMIDEAKHPATVFDASRLLPPNWTWEVRRDHRSPEWDVLIITSPRNVTTLCPFAIAEYKTAPDYKLTPAPDPNGLGAGLLSTTMYRHAQTMENMAVQLAVAHTDRSLAVKENQRLRTQLEGEQALVAELRKEFRAVSDTLQVTRKEVERLQVELAKSEATKFDGYLQGAHIPGHMIFSARQRIAKRAGVPHSPEFCRIIQATIDELRNPQPKESAGEQLANKLRELGLEQKDPPGLDMLMSNATGVRAHGQLFEFRQDELRTTAAPVRFEMPEGWTLDITYPFGTRKAVVEVTSPSGRRTVIENGSTTTYGATHAAQNPESKL